MVRTSRRNANLEFPVRHVMPVQCQASAAERDLQKLIRTAFENLNALARISLAEALMSSPRALLAQVRRMNKTGTLGSSILERFERGVEAAGKGCKLAKLDEIIGALGVKNPQKWRAIVFTRRLDTLELICEELRFKGIRVATIRGGGQVANENSIKAFKSDPPQANVLVSTDAGAVGLNLQVCNVIINYDLPWNPMVLEQRIGRVQRLGSKFQHIEVLNLTVKGSIEDDIVVRLNSKLQIIAATIGDVEAILKASTFEDDGQFVEELRSLVIRALMGQDVTAALLRAQDSITKAKEIYDAEREHVEETLGGMDEMHRSGPAVPKLKPSPPRFDAPTFCRKAFVCEGASISELPNQQIKVAPKGRAPWIATFNEKDPDLLRTGLGTFGGSSIRLYEEGSRAFEGLLGEWRKRHAHRVLDRVEESRNHIKAALQNWVDSFGAQLTVKKWIIRREHLKFNGYLAIRATASISHDRFETLCGVRHCCSEDGRLPDPGPDRESPRDFKISELLPDARKLVVQTVESDSDISEFIRFYDARLEEEVSRAGRTVDQQSEVSRRYETSLAADVVGATGDRYLTIEVDAVFTDSTGKNSFDATIHIVPLTGKIISEPERSRCDSTKMDVPKAWLGDCAISNRRVLLNLLETSAMSRITAMATFFGTCDVSGRRLLNKELGKSDFSGRIVGLDQLRFSELSNKRALQSEFQRCEATGAQALPDELKQSEVSGRMVRIDEIVPSAKSGIRGHRSEFRTCEVTDSLILEEEGACSDLSGSFACKELLVASEKNPNRHGLIDEMVRCTATSKLLLTDEAEESVVSGAWVDKDEAVYSGVSSQPALRGEMLTCAITGLFLLPDEAGTSDVSGKTVDARLLQKSQISAKQALKEELRVCAATGFRILSTEGVQSDVSGKFVRSDEVVESAISKLRGHKTEFLVCSISKDWLLPEEAGKSELSGACVRPDLLSPSEKAPGRKGVDSEFEICGVTGMKLLRDEVARSEVSGRLIDRDLLASSPVSGRLATKDEMLTCEVSGVPLLPDELGVCTITKKRVDLRCLATSRISGRLALKSMASTCEITKVLGLNDELDKSHASGLLCRIDQMEASGLSGLRAHRSELVTCELSRQRLLPSEVAHSSVSNRLARVDLLIHSEKNSERLGFPDEIVVCAASGKRLLQDEVGKSDASGKIVDRDLLIASSVSGRMATEDEFIACEEIGNKLLPDETEVCSITKKRVNRNLIGTSDLSGKRGLSRLLQICPETRKAGFATELVVCAVSKLRVAPSEITTCSVTGETVLTRMMVECAVSGRHLRSDKAQTSDKTGRLGHPDEIRICTWTRRRLLADETRQCGITGLDFDNELLSESSPALPILNLLQSGIPNLQPPDPDTERLRLALGKAGVKAKKIAKESSSDGNTVAYFADCSGLFGLRKRYAVGFAANDEEFRLLHIPCCGQLLDNSWVPENQK